MLILATMIMIGVHLLVMLPIIFGTGILIIRSSTNSLDESDQIRILPHVDLIPQINIGDI